MKQKSFFLHLKSDFFSAIHPTTCGLLAMMFGLIANAETKKESTSFAQQVVANAEATRNIESGVLHVTLHTKTASKKGIKYKMKIWRAPSKRAYVEFLSPKEEQGRRMLVSGQRYLAKFPDSKRVHHISRKEMLVNSVFQLVDLFQFDAKKDFDAKITEELRENGVSLLKVRLTAKHDDAPYASIDYFITKDGHKPARAKFYSFSGKEIKSLTVTKWSQLDQLRPSEFVMSDSVVEGKESYWKTDSIKPEKVPSLVFSEKYIGR